MNIFGYNISRPGPTATEKSIVPPTEDGAQDTYKLSGYYGTYLDLDTNMKSEVDIIRKYRSLSLQADVDMAIEDIVNAAVANLEEEDPVRLDLDMTDLSDNIQEKIQEEFKNISKILNLRHKIHDYFRRWYIDGRIYFHKVIDTKDAKAGIKDVRYIDPRKIKKIRNIEKKRDPQSGVDFVGGIEEYYIFNDKGMSAVRSVSVPAQGLKITKDAICYAPSGLVDMDSNMVLSYLHKAIKPANQLRMMENALVIYRLARAPERRIFYIDTGNLPKLKAEQYLKDIMNKYRNKMVYDADTGELRDDKKFMSMLEDFWLPRSNGGKGTQIETLPGGQNLGQIEDIQYFQRKLYESLNVPISRLEQGGGLNFGRATEITRDELKFTKFINKLQLKFATLFLDLMRTQLVLKGIITEDDWNREKYNIKFKFVQDAYYQETKEQELLRSRGEVLGMIDPYVGKYFSKNYVMKNILRLTDEEISDIEKEIEADPQDNAPSPPMGEVNPNPDIQPPPAANKPAAKASPKAKPKESSK
jgi:Bacteriophage T4-like portal protein (Gp20)